MTDLSFNERRTEAPSIWGLNSRSATLLPLDHTVAGAVDTPFGGETPGRHRQRAILGGVCDHLMNHQREHGQSVSVERNHRAGEDDRFRVLLAIRSGLNLQQSINRSGTVLGRLVVRERERALMRLSRPFTNDSSDSPLSCPRVTSALIRASTFFTR